jgi:hypothetical protein
MPPFAKLGISIMSARITPKMRECDILNIKERPSWIFGAHPWQLMLNRKFCNTRYRRAALVTSKKFQSFSKLKQQTFP